MKLFLDYHFRLIYAVLFSLIVSSMKSVELLIILFLCVIFSILFLYRSQPQILLKRWLRFNIFSVLVWATLSWKIESHGILWNENGIALAKLITLRMNLIVLSVWFFLYRVTDTILAQAVKRLPLPKKFKQLFILTVRYISLLSELNNKMDMAMKARGFQPKCNIYTIKIYAQRVALLLIHAMLKAEKAEIAMKARGFRL